MYQRKPDFADDLKKASNPDLSESMFEELLYKHFGELKMAETLARNPACPFLMFVEFCRYNLQAAQENPDLEKYKNHPQWVGRMRRVWSGSYDAREPLLFKIIHLLEHEDNEYRRYIMSVEDIPGYLVNEYARSKSAPVRAVIAARETVPEGVFEHLAKDSAKTVRAAVAANTMAPIDILARLAVDKESRVAEAAQKNPSCPTEAIHKARLSEARKPSAINKNNDDITTTEAAKLASDNLTPPEKLVELSQHSDPCIRFLTGFNPSTPTEQLTALADDSVNWVQAGPAFNTNTPHDTLKALADKNTRDILIGLASNTALSEADQLKLCECENDDAREVLANMTVYESVWKKLAKKAASKTPAKDRRWPHFLAEALEARKNGKFSRLERDPKGRRLFVSRIGARSESCPENLLRHYACYVFTDYSKNPLAALALLEGKTHVPRMPYQEWKLDKWLSEGVAPGHVSNYFINGDDEKRRIQAISSWTTQIVHLVPLVLHKDTNARKRLAKRPDLLRFMFEMLSRDEKPGVREEIAKNPKTPKQLLKNLNQDTATIVRASAANKKDGQSSTNIVNQGSAVDRARIAKKSEDRELLSQLAKDRAASVRATVADNYHTPEDILALLSSDPEAKVRLPATRRCRDEIILKRQLDDPDADVRLAAAHSRAWSILDKGRGRLYNPEFISLVAASEDPALREIAAQFSDDEQIRRQLMTDQSAGVLRALSKNRHMTLENKLELARQTDDQDTVAEMARNTSSEELFLIAAEKITSLHCSHAIQSHCTMLTRPSVQDRLCKHPLHSIKMSLVHHNKPQGLTDYARQALADVIEEYRAKNNY